MYNPFEKIIVYNNMQVNEQSFDYICEVILPHVNSTINFTKQI